ncbi:hypothetical protein LBMAG56_14240 [Verrucomicrobiota bacterium]|nr:hypothetical protein LBMAG56_14240 [Verrucomicrobiota bacterium]
MCGFGIGEHLGNGLKTNGLARAGPAGTGWERRVAGTWGRRRKIQFAPRGWAEDSGKRGRSVNCTGTPAKTEDGL